MLNFKKSTRNQLVAVLFFKTGPYSFPSSKYKTSTLSKITEHMDQYKDTEESKMRAKFITLQVVSRLLL